MVDEPDVSVKNSTSEGGGAEEAIGRGEGLEINEGEVVDFPEGRF